MQAKKHATSQPEFGASERPQLRVNALSAKRAFISVSMASSIQRMRSDLLLKNLCTSRKPRKPNLAEVEQQPAQPLGIANVQHLKAMIGAPRHRSEIGPVAGVGELVDGEHLIAPHPDQMAHQGRTDEASTAGYDDFHVLAYPLST